MQTVRSCFLWNAQRKKEKKKHTRFMQRTRGQMCWWSHINILNRCLVGAARSDDWHQVVFFYHTFKVSVWWWISVCGKCGSIAGWVRFSEGGHHIWILYNNTFSLLRILLHLHLIIIICDLCSLFMVLFINSSGSRFQLDVPCDISSSTDVWLVKNCSSTFNCAMWKL